jgi:Sap, sulfolipid-1-addressing protein
MVGAAIGAVLGNAVGVAISPVPIIALILMLFSQAAARNGLAFLAGWLLGLTGVAVVVLAIGFQGSSGGGSTAGGVVKIVIGLLFLGLGWRQWRGRPEPGSEPEAPGWLAAVDELSAVRALGLGLLLTVANPKNLGLTIAAAASISGAGLSGGQDAVVVAVFVLLASLTILLPVVAYLSARERAEPLLSVLKDWLMANNATVMTVLFAVLGAKVLGDGLTLLG